MEFVNNTKFAAELARTCLFYRDLTMAITIVKCGFRILPTGDVVPQDEPPQIQGADVHTSYGMVEAEVEPQKRGCDLAIFGSARPFPSAEVRELDIALQIGRERRSWRVFGDRHWEVGEQGLVPSTPVPFSEMLIGNDKAYGGVAVAHGRFTIDHFDNPEGKGYVLLQEHAAGTALPNLEDPSSLIREWTDQPAYKGLTPLSRRASIRAVRGVRVNVDEQRTAIDDAFFASSHPDLWLARYPAGEVLTVIGMGYRERLSFIVPRVDLALQLDLGGRLYELDLTPDTLHIFPDEERFEVTSRRALVYQFVPERRRILTVRHGARNSAETEATIRRALERDDLGIPILPEDDDSPISLDLLRQLNPITDLVEALPLCKSA